MGPRVEVQTPGCDGDIHPWDRPWLTSLRPSHNLSCFSFQIYVRKEPRLHGGSEITYAGGRFLGVVQPAGDAGGTGGLCAGARVHDCAAVRLGVVGEHYGA